MASASSKVGGVTLAVRLFTPLALGSAGYAAWRVNWPVLVRSFLTGPGRTSRVLLLLFAALNWKNLPFAWTYRVFYAIIYHNVLRKSPQLTPRALFKPLISETHAPLLEMDYNLHKSNSTYFTDLDVSRSHLVSFLCRPGLRKLAHNPETKLILDPATDKPVRGSMGIMLGAVHCSFRREIGIYRGYELWSRLLCWDRKWMYIVTHFVKKTAANGAAPSWESKIYATALSKYVFKLGRLTVHPAVVLSESGLLPDRPGGWTSGTNQLGDEAASVADVDLSEEGEWDWRRVEGQRRQGMELAAKFQALDGMHGLFDGGATGALGKYGPC
ncbi:thioesterase-like superfamily domain-containing protein [Hirsutella rhossiliensis]|uniref:Thioesterase-like superfamily domain-containing protein n=1 Tax=Hirsutella rhossiliensis TaxID=111463 RepID=A0A9P8MQ08_9HYPO|nr:thioesterase-like superfamily domain-containing protein [Hirsutella rhossiliensis]KAH0959633.1 thioesterase-like superfamily domain-containing protein [Hirsutella rhossiliensis]